MGLSKLFLLTFLFFGCEFVLSTPTTLGKQIEVSRIVKDETGTKRIRNVIIDSNPEASEYGASEAFLEPQILHHAVIPDTPLTSSDGGENDDHSIELQEGGQTFFPSFTNLFQPRHQPLGHSRPSTVYNQEGAYSQRPSPLRQLLNNYQAPSFSGFKSSSNDYVKPAVASAGSDANGILGSGNFGVIPGGTFFSESGDTESQFSDSFDISYNNGHGRPSFYFGNTNSRPYNNDQFAHFRDFADINSPSSSAFSHYVVVYANKNATLENPQKDDTVAAQRTSVEPKNIIERLAQIDEEKQTPVSTTLSPKVPKISKSKLKLSLLKDKKYGKPSIKKKSVEVESKDLSDPLLALS